MLINNVSWLPSYVQKKSAFFYHFRDKDRIVLVAMNRAARRVLQSNYIRKLASKNGATIKNNSIF